VAGGGDCGERRMMSVAVEIEVGVGEVERVVAEEAAGATIPLNMYIESRPM